MTDTVIGFQDKIRALIHKAISDLLANSQLDNYEEDYDKEKQCWTISLSFNEGDERDMKIKLDINPDG